MKEKILGFVPSFLTTVLIAILSPIILLLGFIVISLIFGIAVLAPLFVLLGERIKVTIKSDGKQEVTLTRVKK